MVVEFLFDGRDIDAYLTRAAKAMDSIDNGIEFENGRFLDQEFTVSEVREFKNYLGDIIYPILKKTVKSLGMKVDGIEEDVLQNLAEIVFRKFTGFNNSRTKEYGEEYCFSTFIKPYIDNAIRKTRAQDEGYSLRLTRKRKRIENARKKAAVDNSKREDEVTVEEIFIAMPDVTAEPLSLMEIKRALVEIDIFFAVDTEIEEERQGREDKILIQEQCIMEDFKSIINKLRPMQQFLFLQSIGKCPEEYDEIHTKQLACDQTFVHMCSNDPIGKKHISHGDFHVDRIKRGNRYYDGVDYSDIDFLEPRYIRDEKGRINNRFRELVLEKEYEELDVIANLVPLLEELRVELNKKYNI